MQFPSVLVVGGNSNTRLAKAQEIAPKAKIFNPTGVEEVRELIRFVSLSQSIIIQQAHNLTPEAQNALLKTLEEPPEDTMIILCASNEDLLLPTIISRCQKIELPSQDLPLSPPERKKLEKVLNWLGDLPADAVKNGFPWAKENSVDRVSAINLIDQLLFVAHQRLFQDHALQRPSEQPVISPVIRKLFKAKKYLQANCNVRLTLENLFLN